MIRAIFILALAIALRLPACAAIVQTKTCSAASGPTVTCVMTSNVTAGNLLVIMTGHSGGDECSTGLATYADTQGSTFTYRANAENVGGGQSNSCIITAPLTSGGAETVTRTASLGNYPASMIVMELGSVGTIAYPATNGATQDLGTAISTGNMTSAAANNLLVCVASDSNPGTSFDSATSPSGSTTFFVAPELGALYKFVANGTYNCTLGKSGGGFRYSTTGLLISFTPSSGLIQRHRVIM